MKLGRNRGMSAFGAAGWLMADLVVLLAFLMLAVSAPKGAESDPATEISSPSETPEVHEEPPLSPRVGLDSEAVGIAGIVTPVGGGDAEADEFAGRILNDARQPGVVMLFGVSWDSDPYNGVPVSQAMEDRLRTRLPEGTAYRSFLQVRNDEYPSSGLVYAEVFYFWPA